MTKKKSTKPVKPEKVEPLWIKGKFDKELFHCPRCQDRDNLDLVDYDTVSGKPGLYWFKWICKPCNIVMEIEEGL